MDTKANGSGRSILRRSSVVLNRRSSRDSTASLEEFQIEQQLGIWSANAAAAAHRRASVQQASSIAIPIARRASVTANNGRRGSIVPKSFAGGASLPNTVVGSLSKSVDLSQAANEQGKTDQQQQLQQLQQQQNNNYHQHDYKDQNLRHQTSSPSPAMESSLTFGFEDMSMSSDWDISSNCSEISELLEDVVDYTDPSDWFLDEEMEDEPMFEILERQELLHRMRESVESVAAQLNVSSYDAVLVLQQFNWDVEHLLHDYFDRPDHYLKLAGVSENPASTSLSGSNTTDPHKCKICMDEKPASEFFALGCGHSFCKECWQEYLQGLSVSVGSEITRTPCMAPKCDAKLTEKHFEIVALPSTLQRYMYFLLKEFSEKELHSVFCPNPACGNAVVYSGTGRPTDVVECHCGTRFCFSCGHEKHNPVSCDRLTEWHALLQDDSGSLDLIKATSKPCFHCGTFTERISGCNHMICRRGTGGCGGEWCWMCRRDWSTHGAHTGGFYSCNKYDESEAKAIDDKSQEYLTTKNESKFLHYYNRYFNHDVLMKDIMKQLSSGVIEATMGEYSKMTNADPEFFLEAAELLVECRRVLKYTYVYGYYMEESPVKALFEYQQASAEGITERLSELFHTPVDVIAKNPLEFVNYVRVTKKFISNLVKSIEEGFASDLESQQ